MKGKDLWDMRDLPLPERDLGRTTSNARREEPKQSIRNRQSTSLAEWGEKADFWNEWNDEFRGAEESRRALAPTQGALELPQNPAPENFSEPLTDDRDIHFEPWASQMAFHERRLEKEGTADYGLPFRRQELLAEKTKEYARLLQAHFRKNIEVFNQSRKSPAHAIHIYKISRSDEDFLIYRNGIKLIVSGQRAGRITLSFNQFLAPHAQTTSHAHVELEATWGAFDQLHWTYKTERVETIDVVRYFLSELAFQSFR